MSLSEWVPPTVPRFKRALNDTLIPLGLSFPTFAPMRRGVVSRPPADEEFTHASKKKTFGPRTTSMQRLMRASALSQDYVKFSFKGLGRPFQYGFYNCEKYSFVDTEAYWALPLYAFDITSCPNLVSGTDYGHCPMLRAYKNVNTDQVEWHICQSQNLAGTVCPAAGGLTKSTSEVLPFNAVNSQWQVLAANNTGTSGARPHNVQYIDTVDIALNLFAARQVPTSWRIDVRKFDANLAPFCKNNSIVTAVTDVEDEKWHNAFWMGELMTMINHPLNYQRGHRSSAVTTRGAKYNLNAPYGTKGFVSLLPKPIIIEQQPKDTSFSEPSVTTGSRMHREKLTLKLRRAYDMVSRPFPGSGTTQQPGGMDQSAATTTALADTSTTTSTENMTTLKQDQRIFLTIMSNDYEDATFNVTTKSPCRALATPSVATVDCWATKINDIPAEIGTHVDFNKSGSFDLHVIKTIVRDSF